MEDYVVNQKVATRILERRGYRPDIAGNGIEAIESIHRRSYDVVLMAVQMPQVDGLPLSPSVDSRACSDLPMLDPEVFQRFQEPMEEMTADILGDFFSEAPKQLNPLRLGLEKKDHEILERTAHLLKSGSALLGAMRLSGLCKVLEHAVREDSLSDAAALLLQIEREYAAVQAGMGDRAPVTCVSYTITLFLPEYLARYNALSA